MSAEARILPETNASIDEAVERLRSGGLVAFPTETVYGLGADATNDTAVARIYEAKGRPSFNPLIVHAASAAAAFRLAMGDPRAVALADAFWPGALTLVLPRRKEAGLSWLVSAGLDTVAVRVPVHPLAVRLLEQARVPIAAPSANRSGQVSPTKASHVARSLGTGVDLILDGGDCPVGLESTIIDLSQPADRPVTLLRPGGVTPAEIESILGHTLAAPAPEAAEGDAPRSSPGQLASHYAPDAPLRMNAIKAHPGEVLIGFGAVAGNGPNLSKTGDLREAAARLFAVLHSVDADRPEAIAVAPIPETGLGIAINDRLRRAAAPRNTLAF